MVLLNVRLNQLKGGVRFKIAEVNGICKLTVGAIKMEHFKAMNFNWVENS